MDMSFEWHTRDEKLLVVDYWWNVQRGLCCLCGELMLPYHRDKTTHPFRATIEHLVPRREGGPNTVGNVKLAHGMCNHALGALWQQNQERRKNGLPPISDEQALRYAASKHSLSGYYLANKNYGKSLREQLGDVEHDRRRSANVARNLQHPKARRMTAVETAQWLAAQGIRGS